MIAVQGLYENGRIELSEDAPMERANVIVIFPGEQMGEKQKSQKSTKELFDDFTGCISREIDEKAERLGALDEKYAYSD